MSLPLLNLIDEEINISYIINDSIQRNLIRYNVVCNLINSKRIVCNGENIKYMKNLALTALNSQQLALKYMESIQKHMENVIKDKNI